MNAERKFRSHCRQQLLYPVGCLLENLTLPLDLNQWKTLSSHYIYIVRMAHLRQEVNPRRAAALPVSYFELPTLGPLSFVWLGSIIKNTMYKKTYFFKSFFSTKWISYPEYIMNTLTPQQNGVKGSLTKWDPHRVIKSVSCTFFSCMGDLDQCSVDLGLLS